MSKNIGDNLGNSNEELSYDDLEKNISNSFKKLENQLDIFNENGDGDYQNLMSEVNLYLKIVKL
jgi:hypothetical protein